MAYEYDELNPRPDQREQLKRQREMARKRQRLQNLAVGLSVTAVALLVLCIVLLRGCNADPGVTTIAPIQSTAPIISTAPTPVPEGKTVINIVAGGDINITDTVVAAGEQDGRYDYTGVFMDIAALFANADAAIVNLEGNVVGAPYGTDSASAPRELLTALKDMGVDFVQMANSFSIKNGIVGLNTTLSEIRQAGMEPLGACASQEEFDRTQGFTIKDIQGVRVAFVAFTKGMGGLALPSGSENRLNLLYTDYATSYQNINTEGITATLEAVAAQQPDVTIALLHWGSEHKSIISANQTAIKDLMLSLGVDAIIGTHSHYVQSVEFDKQGGTVVAYSLGDLIGTADKADTNYSIVLQLQITKDNATGQTRITGCDYAPVYTLTESRDGQAMRLLRLDVAMAMYEHNHVDKVSAKAYESMKSAYNKIKSRTGM